MRHPVQIHKYKYTNTNTQTQIHKYKYTNTTTQIKIHIYKYPDTNTQIQIHKYKYTNKNTQIQIHKYKYINTNKQIQPMTKCQKDLTYGSVSREREKVPFHDLFLESRRLLCLHQNLLTTLIDLWSLDPFF